jgi:HSP20 family protein
MENFVHPVQAARPLTNLAESETEFLIEMTVAGLKKESISIDLVEDKLVIGYIHSVESEAAEWRFNQKEFSLKTFERKFKLPVNARRENIRAVVELGVLRVFIPKRLEEKVNVKQSITID